MKNFFFAAVTLLLLTSCKNQEKPGFEEEIVFNTTESVGTLPAKLNQGKANTITEILNDELEANGIPSNIESVEIIEINATAGDSINFKTVKQHALKAVTKDKKTTITLLLFVKDKEFYLDQGTAAIICTGGCANPCEPGAILKNGKIWLECSGCADCVKTDFML